MEFLGTKGKWIANVLDDIFIETDDKSEKQNVCLIENNGIYDYDKWEYNALLISKAPEMLYLLRDLLNDKGLNEVSNREIKLLIKQATEI